MSYNIVIAMKFQRSMFNGTRVDGEFETESAAVFVKQKLLHIKFEEKKRTSSSLLLITFCNDCPNIYKVTGKLIKKPLRTPFRFMSANLQYEHMDIDGFYWRTHTN
ncbi:hypothetical protein AB6A40_003750 [Gnathostoma spinigerum]|uniref:Uncharacterized protein n=1 Tax=Gnathostoma spinigerum TaxID=75299 RepID=A0ABD6ECW8_9BILA